MNKILFRGCTLEESVAGEVFCKDSTSKYTLGDHVAHGKWKTRFISFLEGGAYSKLFWTKSGKSGYGRSGQKVAIAALDDLSGYSVHHDLSCMALKTLISMGGNAAYTSYESMSASFKKGLDFSKKDCEHCFEGGKLTGYVLVEYDDVVNFNHLLYCALSGSKLSDRDGNLCLNIMLENPHMFGNITEQSVARYAYDYFVSKTFDFDIDSNGMVNMVYA